MTWIVNDGTANSTGITSTITVAVANDAPTVSGNDATLAYTENDGAVLVDSTLTLADVDSANLTGATITISSGFVSGGEDVLSFTAANGISGTFDNSTGILALSGSATKAQYETALESVKYENTSENPNTGNRTVSWVVTDGSDSSSAVYSTITVAAADNDAPSLGGAGGTLAYTESGAAAVIDSALTLSDGDDTNMESATVEITGGFVSGEDVLSFTNANGITHTWDSTTGVLSLSGTSSIANYKAALESVKYDNTNDDNPNTSSRTITWIVNDGDNNSAAATSTITVAGVNDAPTGADAGATLAFTEGDGASVIDSSLTLADVDDTNLDSATVQITTGYQSGEDVLAFANQSGITGSWDSTSGTLSLSGSATKEQYETALETITYNNTSDTPNTSNRTVTWIVNDGTANSTGITSTITVAVANDAPTVSGNDATLAYTENDGAVLVDSTLTLADVDSANLTGATITISSGFVSGGEDVLSFTAANGISGTFDNSTGILALSGSATKAQYETALESVKYENTSENPNTGNRTVSWVVTDGSDSSSCVFNDHGCSG